MHRYFAVILLLCAACEHAGADADASDSGPADSADAGDGAVDAADAATAADAEIDVAAIACTAAQQAACDDHNPCTVDVCAGPDGACSHAGAASSCDDGDPCTVDDVCASGNCKGKAKDCDDKSPCTIDNCQLDGTCTHVHNQHEDCLPLIALDQPPRALRLQSANPTLTVAGKLVTQNSPPKSLTVQGKDVAFDANGAFSTTVPLQFGAQTLVLEVTDAFGGKRLQVQGVHWSPEWRPGVQSVTAGDLRIAAATTGLLGNLQASLAKLQFAVPRAFGQGAVQVALGWSAQPPPPVSTLPSAHFTALPVPVTVAEAMAATLTTDPGTPLQQACAPLPVGLDVAGPSVQWTVTHDFLNAALRASWLGGALAGDVSPIGDGLVPGVTVMGQIRADLPWLLQDCPGTAATLRLADLRLDMQAYLGDPPELLATAVAHIAIEATPVYMWDGTTLQLRLGATQSIQLDLATGSKDMQATDVHVAMEKALKEKSLPLLLAEWAKAPLVAFYLPSSSGNALNWLWQNTVTVLAGVVRMDGALSMP